MQGNHSAPQEESMGNQNVGRVSEWWSEMDFATIHSVEGPWRTPLTSGTSD